MQLMRSKSKDIQEKERKTHTLVSASFVIGNMNYLLHNVKTKIQSIEC